MKVMETFLRGKESPTEKCEDGFIVTEDYAVMIDGASAKSDLLINGKKTGRFIMEEIKNSIYELEPDINAMDFKLHIDKSIRDSYEREGIMDLILTDKKAVPEANVVVFSKSRRELWFFGDAIAMVDGVPYDNTKYIDEITSSVRKLVNEYHLITGSKTEEELLLNDEGSKFIKPLLAMQQHFHDTDYNTSFAYSCINGFGTNEDHIKVVPVSKNAKHIVLATDGYQELCMTLEETELLLKDTIDKDILGIREFKTFRGISKGLVSYDDRAYLKIRL